MKQFFELNRLFWPTLTVGALALGACGRSAPPGDPRPAPSADAAPAATSDVAAEEDEPAAPDCVPNAVAAVIGSLEPELARIEGESVELCGLIDDGRSCVALNLESGLRTTLAVDENDVKRIPEYPSGFDDGIIRDEKRPLVKVCLSAETGCKDLHAGQVLAARFDATRSQVVITSWDDGMRKAKIYDPATLELKHAFDISPGDLPDCTFASFVGQNLLISTGPCTGGGTSWLLDPATGAKVADVGGDSPLFIRDGEFAAVPQAGENIFAFRSADGDTVVLQDVTTGVVSARLDLEEAVGDSTPKHDGAWVLAHERGIVLVESRPLPDSIYLVDSKTLGVLKTYLPRPCP